MRIRGSISKMNFENSMIFIDTMSKYAVLASVALLSTLVTVIVASLRYFENNKRATNDIYVFYTYLLAASIVIDSMINVVCLKWQFSFWANKEYFRFCRCCHSIARNIVMRSSDMPEKPIENEPRWMLNIPPQGRTLPSTSVTAAPSTSSNETDK